MELGKKGEEAIGLEPTPSAWETEEGDIIGSRISPWRNLQVSPGEKEVQETY